MRARLLLCVSYVTLLTVASLTLGAAHAQQTDPLQQRENAIANTAGIAVGDLSETTVGQLRDAITAEGALKSAQEQQTSAQQKLNQANADVASAKTEAAAAMQKLRDQGIDPVAAANGTVTTANQAKLEKGMNDAWSAVKSAEFARDQAAMDANLAKANPKAYSKADLDALEPRLRNAQEHLDQALKDYDHATLAAKTDTLAAVQAYNAVQIKLNNATTAQADAQKSVSTAQTQVFRAQENVNATATIVSNLVHTDMQTRLSRDADAAAAAARANQPAPVSVLAGAQGAQLLNINNVQQLVSTGTIKVSGLDSQQLAAIVASGAGNLASPDGTIKLSDLTPQMLSQIVAQGAGNIVAQGAGNIVAQGAGNVLSDNGLGIVAQGAGNLAQLAAVVGIVAQGAGNIVSTSGSGIISTNGGGIVAQGAGNLGALINAAAANAATIEPALLAAGVQASIISNDGASLIQADVAKGLISNDGGSLINNGGSTLINNGGSTLISNDGGSLVGNSGGTLVGNAGGTIIGNDGASVIGNDGNSLISNDGGSIISTNSGGFVPRTMGFRDVAPVPPPTPAPPTQPRGVPGGGFRHETQISIGGNYDTSPNPGAKPGGTVVASVPPATTNPPSTTTTPPPTTTTVTSAPPKAYDPNDWTTWPKADINSFLPPGKSVQQFKAGAEQDLSTYRKNLAALPATGLTPAQQSQKAGMEAQIRSLEFQIDTANRSLGAPTATTAAPKPVDLSAAVAGLNARAAQIADANQDLSKLQVQRRVATDPAQQRSLDAAISAAQSRIDGMQKALDTEVRNVNELGRQGAQTAAASAVAKTPAETPAVPVMSAAAIAGTVKLQGDLPAAEKAVNDRAQQIASASQQLQQFQAQRAAATDPAQQKGLDAAISSAKFQIDVMQKALDRENQNVTDLRSSAAKSAALNPAPAAAPAASPAAPAAAATPVAPAAPLKITAAEQKGLEQALRTVPGKLSAPEKKTLDSLSALAQKAASKGLSPEETAALKDGMRVLVQHHPKAVAHYKLGSLVEAAAKPSAAAAPAAAPLQVNAAPATAKLEPVKPHEAPHAPAHPQGAVHANPAPAHAAKPADAPKPPAAHRATAAIHPPAVHPAKPIAAPPKPHINVPKPHVNVPRPQINVPKPVAVAKPVAPPKPNLPPPPMAPVRR